MTDIAEKFLEMAERAFKERDEARARIELLEAERDEWKSSHQALEVYYVDGQARIERLEAGIEEYACTGTDHPCGCHTLLTADKARIARLEAMIQCLIDNHDHGSYESEGQAFDEARAALAGKEGT